MGMTERENSKNRLTPTMLDIAWAAGIYEGEGCLHLKRDTKGNHSVSITCTVSQKDWWLPFRLRDLFGGRVCYADRPAGTHRLTFDSHIYTWHCNGARAAGFLMTIYTFLSERRQVRIDEVLTSWKVAA